MNTFETEGKDKWAHLIGQVMIGFGDIEYITLECLHVFPTENIFPSVSKMNLSPRIDLIINIGESKFQKEEEKNPIIDCLKKAKELATKRNLIAHNPMSMDVYANENDEIYGFKEVIASLRNKNNKLHYEDLEQLAKDVEEVKQHLMYEFGRLGDKIIKAKNA